MKTVEQKLQEVIDNGAKPQKITSDFNKITNALYMMENSVYHVLHPDNNFWYTVTSGFSIPVKQKMVIIEDREIYGDRYITVYYW